jgi:hypothetical protein
MSTPVAVCKICEINRVGAAGIGSRFEQISFFLHARERDRRAFPFIEVGANLSACAYVQLDTDSWQVRGQNQATSFLWPSAWMSLDGLHALEQG